MDLFAHEVAHERLPATQHNHALHQWFTPAWAAEAIIEQEFGWLRSGHRVLEPSCGDGAFLCAMPREVHAFGVDIDPVQADLAATSSGRPVIVGDFLQLSSEELGIVDAVIGNPPFEAKTVAAFLDKSSSLMVEGGQVGFILPAYILQTSSKVEQLSRSFSIHQQLLPRNLFPRLKLPLVFARFVKERQRRLFGFLLYREAQDMRELKKAFAATATTARHVGGAWHQVVQAALSTLGGEADLSRIYEVIERRRPTGNPFWKEKIRQILQSKGHFTRTSQGRYALRTLQTEGSFQ